MGTFLAILTGTILAGLVIKYTPSLIGVVTIAIAITGYIVSRGIPYAKAPDPKLKIDYNPIRETMHLHRIASKTRSVIFGVIGISWFWFVGGLLFWFSFQA